MHVELAWLCSCAKFFKPPAAAAGVAALALSTLQRSAPCTCRQCATDECVPAACSQVQ